MELARERWADFFASVMSKREPMLATVEVVGERADVWRVRRRKHVPYARVIIGAQG
jgi:hypothetical protein